MAVTLHLPPASDLTPAEIARWVPVPTAVAVDMLGGAGQIDPAIRPLRPPGQQPRLFGQAVTVRCEAPDFGAVLHALDVIKRGQVLVIDAGGHRDNAMIGDILSGALRDKGVAGLVCDGAVRDVGIVGNWTDFPVFSRWINPRGPSGAQRGAINLAVVIGGCVVAPGDLIIGDDDGLVALSPANVRTAIAAAEAKLERETVWISALAAGKSVAEVFGLAPAVIHAPDGGLTDPL
ncbi:MAG: dimethylmenaquinone methyltransferase [Pseudorhodobacter sp.]|nr:dimethylmenaquinone methyltransferase [Pseudorhodobacter sp.]